MTKPSNWRWPDFSPSEMACRHCGKAYHWPAFMDALQTARDQIGRPFHILSAHRCSLHNARVGGAPQSQHLRLAVDIALRGHDPGSLHMALRQSGFAGFGFYTTFIHADMGPTRHWFGTRKARTQWQQDKPLSHSTPQQAACSVLWAQLSVVSLGFSTVNKRSSKNRPAGAMN